MAFKAQADHKRIEQAKDLLEQRFQKLDFSGRQIGKEKLLTFLALGLADDLLQSNQDMDELEGRITRLLDTIDKARS